MLSSQSSTRRSFSPLILLSLLVALLAPAALVSAQDDDLSWVPFDREQFDGNEALDKDGNVQLFWTLGDEYSTYGIASKSEGFLAVGFSETGAMTGADIALGYTNDDGEFVLENRNAAGFVEPDLSADQSENLRLKEGSQADGVTAFTFEKKNVADCLQEQVDVETGASQWFIYAFSDDNTFAQHAEGKNGKKYVKLGDKKTISVNEVREVEGTKEFTITQPEITIPNQETTYCYTLHKLPEGEKNFILSERPAESSNLLHHLVVYSCFDLPEQFKSMEGEEPNCDFEGFSNPCTGFVTEWAPGMSGRTFEEGFGKPFGSEVGYEYVMLETHYNNPDGVEGETDSAGYTFLYTEEPVETEIGTLTLGDLQVTGWTLEPGKEIVQRKTVCTPECTKKWPEEGIIAFSVFFHMHQRGRNERVQVVRDDKEVLSISIRDFEYGYQFAKDIGEIKLLPGDKLITTCEFDTSGDTEPVPGGLASKDEMCFAWVDYYPANQVIACTQFDLSQFPDTPINGTAAACIEAQGNPEEAIYPSLSLYNKFEEMPETGNVCAASVTENEDSSDTSSEPAATTTSAASSGFSSLYRALITFAAPLALSAVFTQFLL